MGDATKLVGAGLIPVGLGVGVGSLDDGLIVGDLVGSPSEAPDVSLPKVAPNPMERASKTNSRHIKPQHTSVLRVTFTRLLVVFSLVSFPNLRAMLAGGSDSASELTTDSPSSISEDSATDSGLEGLDKAAFLVSDSSGTLKASKVDTSFS